MLIVFKPRIEQSLYAYNHIILYMLLKISTNMRNLDTNCEFLKLLRIVLVVGCLINPSQTCSLQENKTTTMEERLADFDIVVYGKDVQHIVRKGIIVDFTDSILEVYCVIKGDANVTGNITIEEIFPKTPCSGTYMYYLQKLGGNYSPGLEIIVGLKRTENGNYLWQEVNNLESSAFEPTVENWNRVEKVLSAKTWTDVGNTDTGCPKRFYPNAAQSSQIKDSEAEVNGSQQSSLEPEATSSKPPAISSYSQLSTDMETDAKPWSSTKPTKPGVKDDELKTEGFGSPRNGANYASLFLSSLTMLTFLLVIVI